MTRSRSQNLTGRHLEQCPLAGRSLQTKYVWESVLWQSGHMELLKPALSLLPSYRAALESGWSPDNLCPERGREELARIDTDAPEFISSLDDVEARGAPVTLPDGTQVPRLPGFKRWMWDREFCGSVGFRWQKGTSALPAPVLGHIGFSVVSWKQGRGYAKKALALMLDEVRGTDGVTYVELMTSPGNIASRKVIEACGGTFVERFFKGPNYGRSEALRYRISL